MDAHWYRHRWRPRLPQAPPPRSLKAGSAPAAAFAEQAAELGGIKEADALGLLLFLRTPLNQWLKFLSTIVNRGC
jgi:hypothetical protein